MKQNVKKKILVNLITSLRLLGTFLIIPIYLYWGWGVTALVVGVLFTTDFLDGTLARCFHVETFFGCILDSIADKAFAIIILAILALVNPIFIICIVLEIIISLINYKSVQNGNNVQSSKLGKIKTLILDFTVVFALILIAVYKLTIMNLSLSLYTILNFITIPSLIAQLLTIKDYSCKALKNTNLNSKNQIKVKELKSRNEILDILFNTDFYHEHREDRLKNLLFK